MRMDVFGSEAEKNLRFSMQLMEALKTEMKEEAPGTYSLEIDDWILIYTSKNGVAHLQAQEINLHINMRGTDAIQVQVAGMDLYECDIEKYWQDVFEKITTRLYTHLQTMRQRQLKKAKQAATVVIKSI